MTCISVDAKLPKRGYQEQPATPWHPLFTKFENRIKLIQSSGVLLKIPPERVMSQITDNDIRLLLGSDAEKAFRLIVDTYGSRLYWHIRRLVVIHDDADDALQNTFISAWKNIDSFRFESSLLTWLWSIATNEALSLIRKREKQSSVSLDDIETILAQSVEGSTYFDGDDASVKLHNAILKLPEKQRIVFNMKYFDDMSYEEMSGVTGTSVGALKASYHHAVKKIEQYLLDD
jgi:RNA polymerase sigma-70 factor (ECF subfamily)